MTEYHVSCESFLRVKIYLNISAATTMPLLHATHTRKGLKPKKDAA